MENSQDLQSVIDQVTKLFRKNHLSYEQTKYIVQEARKYCTLKPKKVKKGSAKRLSKTEIKDFINSAYQRNAKIGLLMTTLYETAARVDEFVNLTPSDLFDSDMVIVIKNGKGDKRREIPISENLVQKLKIHLQGRSNGYLFESNRYHKFTTRRIEQITIELGKAAKIKQRVTPHTLRHTRATLLAEMGMVKDLLQKFLGHESSKTTEIYTNTAALDVKKEFYRITE